MGAHFAQGVAVVFPEAFHRRFQPPGAPGWPSALAPRPHRAARPSPRGPLQPATAQVPPGTERTFQPGTQQHRHATGALSSAIRLIIAGKFTILQASRSMINIWKLRDLNRPCHSRSSGSRARRRSIRFRGRSRQKISPPPVNRSNRQPFYPVKERGPMACGTCG